MLRFGWFVIFLIPIIGACTTFQEQPVAATAPPIKFTTLEFLETEHNCEKQGAVSESPEVTHARQKVFDILSMRAKTLGANVVAVNISVNEGDSNLRLTTQQVTGVALLCDPEVYESITSVVDQEVYHRDDRGLRR